jgi:hypothetical protein
MYRRIARKRSARSLVVSLPPPGTGATLPHCCQHSPGRAYIHSSLALPRQRCHAAPERVATKRPAAPFVFLTLRQPPNPRCAAATPSTIASVRSPPMQRSAAAKPPATLQSAASGGLASASQSELHRRCPFQVVPSPADPALSAPPQVPRSRVAKSCDGREPLRGAASATRVRAQTRAPRGHHRHVSGRVSCVSIKAPATSPDCPTAAAPCCPRRRRAHRCCPPPCAHAHASRRRSTRHLRRLRQRAARPPSDTPRRRCTTEASQPAQSKPASEPREQRSGRLRRGMRTARPLGARRLRDAAPGASRLRMKCARRSPAEICTLRPVPSDCIAAPRRPECPDAGGARSQALAARREQLRACRCPRPATAARWARRAAPCRRPRRCPPRPRSRRAGQQQQAGKLRQAHARWRAALPVTTRGLAASRRMHSAGAAAHADWPRTSPPAGLRR